ncbi:MAG: hypothetical protein WCI73_16865 [Phycisphaerae bacterium]
MRQLDIGLLLYLYSLLFSMLEGLLSILLTNLRYTRFDPFERFLFYFFTHPLLYFIPEIITLLSVWFLTTPRPGASRPPMKAYVLRAFTSAWLLIDIMLWLKLDRLFLDPQNSRYAELIATIETLGKQSILFGFYWFFWAHLLTLLPSTYPPAIARAGRRFRIICPVVYTCHYLQSHGFIQFWVYECTGLALPYTTMKIITISVGILSMIVVLWSVWILFALLRQFHREAPVSTREMIGMGVSWIRQVYTRLRYYASYHGSGRG